MKPKPESERRERQDWLIVLLILLLGFACVCVSAQYALRLSPNWTLNTDMNSGIDPNSDFLTKPGGFVEPIDSGILTQPAWVKIFLTPGAKVVTGTPPPARPTRNASTEESTVAVATNTLPAITLTNTVIPTNTLIWYPPPAATSTKKPKKTKVPPPDTAVPPTNPPPTTADLTITNNDSADYYVPGDIRTYTIIVSNTTGPSDITGATVANIVSGPFSGVTWSCVAVGTVCGAGGPGTIADLVNLPVGSSITYTVDVTADASGGDLVNTASVTLPAGATDPTVPNQAIDTDTLFVVPGPPPGGLGTHNPASCDTLFTGDSITFAVTAPGIIDDDASPDLIYYEEPQLIPPPPPPAPPATPGILMDDIIIELSDGLNWYTYTAVNWGDDAPNGGTNLPSPADEYDNYPIDSAALYDNTGILIYIPPSFQNGDIVYVRITVPGITTPIPPGDDNVCVDALVPYP